MTCIKERMDAVMAEMQKELKLVLGAFYIPKDDDSKPRGDDAYFICEERKTIGVFDGVGGWSRKGIDAGIYARELMTNCYVSTLLSTTDSFVDPKKILIEAHSNTKVMGSSTACIITLQQNYLCAANLGDSGFLVLRQKKVIYQSPVQQNEFNCPFQLGDGTRFNSPTLAMELKVQVQARDIIVAGTDGLFDNMFPREVEKILESKEGYDPERMAEHITERALYNSMDKHSESPFSTAAKHAGKRHRGGKIDDITVVVAFVNC